MRQHPTGPPSSQPLPESQAEKPAPCVKRGSLKPVCVYSKNLAVFYLWKAASVACQVDQERSSLISYFSSLA